MHRLAAWGFFLTFCIIQPKVHAHTKQPGVELGKANYYWGFSVLHSSAIETLHDFHIS